MLDRSAILRRRHHMGAVIAALVLSTSACDELNDLIGGDPDEDEIVEQSATVYRFPEPSVVNGATATLVRTDSTLSVTFDTHDLVAGETVTLWWTIFNFPENCVHPDEPAAGWTELEGLSACGELDLFEDGVEGSSFYAVGAVVDSDGRATFSATVSIGDDVSDCDFVDFGICGDGLVNPLGAEIHSFLRSHGPPIPELINEQLETFAGGCTPESSFELGDGPFECYFPQFTVFSPPTE